MHDNDDIRTIEDMRASRSDRMVEFKMAIEESVKVQVEPLKRSPSAIRDEALMARLAACRQAYQYDKARIDAKNRRIQAIAIAGMVCTVVFFGMLVLMHELHYF